MEILNLSLKAKWYNMIESGEKTEEYRELKEYWIKRLFKNPSLITVQLLYSKNIEFKHYDIIKFRYGYTKRIMLFEIKSIDIGIGKPEWGGTDKKVFILKLGKKL